MKECLESGVKGDETNKEQTMGHYDQTCHINTLRDDSTLKYEHVSRLLTEKGIPVEQIECSCLLFLDTLFVLYAPNHQTFVVLTRSLSR